MSHPQTHRYIHHLNLYNWLVTNTYTTLIQIKTTEVVYQGTRLPGKKGGNGREIFLWQFTRSHDGGKGLRACARGATWEIGWTGRGTGNLRVAGYPGPTNKIIPIRRAKWNRNHLLGVHYLNTRSHDGGKGLCACARGATWEIGWTGRGTGDLRVARYPGPTNKIIPIRTASRTESEPFVFLLAGSI